MRTVPCSDDDDDDDDDNNGSYNDISGEKGAKEPFLDKDVNFDLEGESRH